MSTITKEFTKEQLIEHLRTRIEHRKGLIASMHIDRGYRDYLKLELRSSEIALASLEAEPVAYSLIFRNMDGVLNDYVNANTTFSTIEKAQAYGRGGNYVRQNDGSMKWVSDPSLDPVVIPLYTAAPAPVSVPDYPDVLPCPVMLEPGLRFGKGVQTKTMLGALQRRAEYHEELEAMTPEQRAEHDAGMKEFAAMLQGADRNSPVIPDGWVMVPVEPTAEMISSGIAAHYERNQIQIHDRPAPGPMECAYLAMVLAAQQEEATGNSHFLQDGWVACSERMPETMVSVLVTGTWFRHAVAFWDGLSWCDLDFEPPVTHWMPLPAAPKQES